MRRITILFFLIGSALVGQNQNPFIIKDKLADANLKWYSETGTRVYGTALLGGVANAGLDTIVSEPIEVAWYDSVVLSFTFQTGDTVRYNVVIQVGRPDSASVAASAYGFYTPGWGGLTKGTINGSSTIRDSIVVSGIYPGGGRNISIRPWSRPGAGWIRIVLLPYVGNGTAILNGSSGGEATFLRRAKLTMQIKRV